jgi:DNA-binding NarL/FixJ family response regulator
VGQQELRVDVVLIDAQLPGTLNGFGLMRQVSEKRPAAKIIMVGTLTRAAAVAIKSTSKNGNRLFIRVLA